LIQERARGAQNRHRFHRCALCRHVLHKYLYANANPVMNWDPSGQYSYSEIQVGQGADNLIRASAVRAIPLSLANPVIGPVLGTAGTAILKIGSVAIVTTQLAALSVGAIVAIREFVKEHENEQSLTFFRGTSFYAAMEIVGSQSLDADRISVHQEAGSGNAKGMYITSQLSTANYYANLWYKAGLNGGPGVVRMSIDKKQFISFVVKNGILVETPVSRMIGQTETLIPFDAAPEFNAITKFSLMP
jgi:hypothetical protein